MAPYTLQQELAYAFLLALETPMRQGEILGPKVRDMNLKGRYLRLEITTKRGETQGLADKTGRRIVAGIGGDAGRR
ncbi:hypothetical protein PsyrH_20200 [Pseudomonas syringae pv. syringae HS191]|nr:hypothetical protein PsyrH_20200 [Pseudomonas syringae pv. syringae HS191]